MSGGNSMARHAGDKAEREASENERDRIGNPNQLGDREKRGGRRKDSNENEAVGRREVHGSETPRVGHGSNVKLGRGVVTNPGRRWRRSRFEFGWLHENSLRSDHALWLSRIAS